MQTITILRGRNKALNGKVILFDENTELATIGKKTYKMRADQVGKSKSLVLWSTESNNGNARITIDEYILN
jgi:hypothetical protein